MKALELADAYADAVSTHRLESLYGTSKRYTLEKAKERDEAHEDLAAELRRLAAVEADCAHYLKEGETPAERIKRALGDADSLMNLYRDVVAERDALKAENDRLTNCLKKANDQAEDFERRWYLVDMELERIKQSWDEWIKKTEWVQETYQPKELGRHRADVLRMRIEALQAELERIKALPPFAEVRLNKTGGNAGLSTHIVQLAEGYFPAGTKLYALGSKHD